MEFVPWTSFSRIVATYSGDARAMTLPCTEHFRAMAYAQLTWRESLRDIEATLGANSSKLYGMGFRQPVRRSTLADANERRDWRIWHDLAMLMIDRARKLHAQDALDLDVKIAGNVYALDSTTIDLCLSLFDWAPFRSTKAAVKLHTLLDLRGNIPSFIHISDGKMGDVTVLDILPVEPGAFYVMDRGYVDFERLYAMHQGGAFFVTRAKSNTKMRRVYSTPVEKSGGLICDQSIKLCGVKSLRAYPEHIRRVRFHDPITDKGAGVSDQQHQLACRGHYAALQKPLAGGVVLQVDQAASAHQEISGYQRERCEDANLVRYRHLRAHRHCQKRPQPENLTLHMFTDFVGVCF